MSTTVNQPSSEYLAQDIGPTIIATASLLIILSTLFVGLRYYARHLARTKFGIEDLIIPFAWLAEVGLCITGIIMVQKASTGRHLEYITFTDPGRLVEHLKGIVVVEIIHLPAVAFSKLAVLLLYLKIFTSKTMRLITWLAIYIVIGTWFSYTVAIMFQCRPFAFNWDKSIPGGTCFDTMFFSESSSIPNIVTDIIVLLLPIRTVIGLRISLARRIGLLLIFFLGSIGIVASIIRTVVLCRVGFADITYKHTEVVNWTMMEPGMYLLAACALSFKPLFHLIAKSLNLSQLVTHTHSYVWKQGKNRDGKVMDSESSAYFDTLKSSGSGGFSKLHSRSDLVDEEASIGMGKPNNQVDVSVTVTRSRAEDEKGRDTQYESSTENERYTKNEGVGTPS